MYLEAIKITNFKNYEEASLKFSPFLNLIVGMNGTGKTNLLDAVHYLCFCKSYFNATDSVNIRHQQGFFRLEGLFFANNQHQNIVAKIGNGRKKEMLRDKVPYKKLSEHIGLLPLVMIAPDDVDLVKGGSEDRRKLIDSTLAQFDKTYLAALISYNKILQQRNALLKSFYENQNFNPALLATYNDQLVPQAQHIYEKRKELTLALLPLLQQFYEQLSGGREEVGCSYKSPLHDKDLATILQQNQQQDRYAQRTTQGVHRDDWLFVINHFPLKKFGSQGQQKSFLIALKMAIYKYIQQKKGVPPILLLDDIFDKLDQERIKQLLAIVTDTQFGQVFVSDTQLARIQAIFTEFNVSYKAFDVSDCNNIVSAKGEDGKLLRAE